MAFVGDLISDVSVPWKERQDALDRIYVSPGLPSPGTSSFWMKDLHSGLHNTRSSTLPQHADIVIIGTGITGTSVAHTLLSHRSSNAFYAKTSNGASSPRVVMLDAREVCSGATGRNGGHCLETVEAYLSLKELLGSAAAQRVISFRLKHMSRLIEVAESLNIVAEAQVRKVQFLSAHYDSQTWGKAKASILAFKTDMPGLSKEWAIIDDPQDLKKRGIKEVIGIVEGPAGALWPYKFVTSILARLREDYDGCFSIETYTPATHIDKTDDRSYLVSTPRGTIRCEHVVHCTNAHVSHLVNELSGKIYPVRGHMSAQTVSAKISNQSHKHSWLFNYKAGFDYMTQLPQIEGICNAEMMLGGGFVNSKYCGVREMGVSKDNKIDPETSEYLAGTLDRVLEPCKDSSGSEASVKAIWSGTMGFSADGLPWVGEIPSSLPCEGISNGRQWTASGFSGEGMVHAWLCGEALASMIQAFGSTKSEEVRDELLNWFPEEMMITRKRLSEVSMPRIARCKSG